MNTVAIAGASGVVGRRVLHYLLAHPSIDSVVAIGRRPLVITDPKLASLVVDLRDRNALAAAIPKTTATAFCCLGTTLKRAGSKEAFRAVDLDGVVAFAAAARGQGATRFILVSSVGASAASRNFYLRTKGEAEEAVSRLGYRQVTVLRPSFIDDEGAREEHRTGERVMLPLARAVFAVVGKTSRYAPISADAIARAMVHLAFDITDEPIRMVESDALHQVSGRFGR